MIWHWVFQNSLNKLIFALIFIIQQGILNVSNLQANREEIDRVLKRSVNTASQERQFPSFLHIF